MRRSDEIFRIRFPEETVIIGPRGAFGVNADAGESSDWIGLRLSRIRHDPHALAGLRRAARLWQVVGDLESVDDTSIIDRVALAARGRLVAVRAPNSGAVATARIDLKTTIDRVRHAHDRRTSRKAGAPGLPGLVARETVGAPLPGSGPAGASVPHRAVATMSIEERLVEILHRTAESPRLTAEVSAQLRAMISPEQIATTVAVLAAWIASQFLGIGLVFDILMLGLGLFMLGEGMLDASRQLMRFFVCVKNATTEFELDEAADLLAHVIVKIGINVLRAAIRRGVSRTTGGKGPEGAGKGGGKEKVAGPTKELDAKPVSTRESTPLSAPPAHKSSAPPDPNGAQKLLTGRKVGEQKLLPAGEAGASHFAPPQVSPPAKPFSGRVMRATPPKFQETAFDIHANNVNANHRYSAKGQGAVYVSLSRKAMEAEMKHYNIPLDTMVAVEKDVQIGRVLDLTDPNVVKALNIDEKALVSNDYGITQAIGRWAEGRYDAIRVPSARAEGETNLVMFGTSK